MESEAYARRRGAASICRLSGWAMGSDAHSAVAFNSGGERIAHVIERALQKEGFGVLTRIDVKETLKKKLGVEQAPFVILGACNPALAQKALGLEPEVGLLLPCNVVVREVGPGQTRVEAINPIAMMSIFPHAGLEAVAEEAQRRLSNAIETF